MVAYASNSNAWKAQEDGRRFKPDCATYGDSGTENLNKGKADLTWYAFLLYTHCDTGTHMCEAHTLHTH